MQFRRRLLPLCFPISLAVGTLCSIPAHCAAELSFPYLRELRYDAFRYGRGVMVDILIKHIRHKLAHHEPETAIVETPTRAAVGMLLKPHERDLHVLFIHRAHHPLDPWSGHMAFPGGRQDPEDPDLWITVHRETREEVGIDLDRHGEYLGRLTELQAMARGRPTNMIVSPFVYLVSPEVSPNLDPV